MDPIYGPEVPRRIVQIAAYGVECRLGEREFITCFALADDGSIWRGFWLDGWEWMQMPQLPGKREVLDPEAARIIGFLNRTIDDMELSVRSYNSMRAAGVRTVADIVRLGKQRLMSLRNFGYKSLKEVQDLIEGMDLKLDMDLTPYGLEMKTHVRRRMYDPMVPLEGKEAHDADQEP